MKATAIPMPAEVVKDTFAVRVLDHVLHDPPAIHRLMGLIEVLVGRVPTERDALSGARRPRFTYQVATDEAGKTTVRLWIGQVQVELPKRHDVHAVLAALCTERGLRLTGPQARAKLDVSNASEACKLIRAALNKAHAGASGWLLSSPFRWDAGKEPKPRPGSPPIQNSPQ